MKKRVLVAGAGKVGKLLACLLADAQDYEVHLADVQFDPEELPQSLRDKIHYHQLNVTETEAWQSFIKAHPIDAVVSCLPYFCNLALAYLADQSAIHYFDLTEDVVTTEAVKRLSQGKSKAYAPSCGLAPGFVNLAAHHLMQGFSDIDTVKLRVGGLPLVTNNALMYALTWSTDGLINEYGNICRAIIDDKAVELQPLENTETIELDGIIYEAFNTSGGVGSLVDTCLGKTKNLNYKTIRYPGHCEKMRFLMNDLKLNEDRPSLKRILEAALPKVTHDVVIIYISVIGHREDHFTEALYVNKFYSQVLFGKTWAALQITTAASAAALIDLVLSQPEKYHGMVLQEDISWPLFLSNQFGKIFKSDNV